VEKLSSSYRGHAQMIGLVASWLDTLPVSTTALENKVTFDVSEGAVISTKGASWDPAEELLYSHLKDVINDNYDPRLVSNVLSGSAVEPEWLTQMLGDKKWRLMLIELAETHKVCSFGCADYSGRLEGLTGCVCVFLARLVPCCSTRSGESRRRDTTKRSRQSPARTPSSRCLVACSWMPSAEYVCVEERAVK
jgi:hypothetical protein